MHGSSVLRYCYIAVIVTALVTSQLTWQTDRTTSQLRYITEWRRHFHKFFGNEGKALETLCTWPCLWGEESVNAKIQGKPANQGDFYAASVKRVFPLKIHCCSHLALVLHCTVRLLEGFPWSGGLETTCLHSGLSGCCKQDVIKHFSVGLSRLLDVTWSYPETYI